jgi:hypothetical protein
MKNVLIVCCVLFTTYVMAGTVGTVNGMKVSTKEANKALRTLTQTKTTWSQLSKERRVQLMNIIAPSKLVSAAARGQLSQKEKQAALAAYWMQKKTAKIRISDSTAKKAYNKMVKAAKKVKSKKKIPSFAQAKNGLKMQLAQEKVISSLMKRAKIRLK